MAGKLKEYSNIRTFKKRNKQFNIGLLIFGVIFIYLIVTGIYLSNEESM